MTNAEGTTVGSGATPGEALLGAVPGEVCQKSANLPESDKAAVPETDDSLAFTITTTGTALIGLMRAARAEGIGDLEALTARVEALEERMPGA